MAAPQTRTIAGYPGTATAARVIQAPSAATAYTGGYTGATVVRSGGIVQSATPTMATQARTISSGAVTAATATAPVVSGGVRQAKVLSSGITAGATAPTVVSSQGIRTVVAGASAPRIVQAARPATVIRADQPNTIAGPTYTQSSYENKHKDDPQLQNLKELRKLCGLKSVAVNDALQLLKAASVDGQLTRQQFTDCYIDMLTQCGEQIPSEEVQKAVFDLFDRDDNGVVDMMELICGASLLCTGTEEDKIHAVFNVFDENGDGVISMDEMFKFLTSVFKVVLTPNVMAVMNSMGVSVESAEDLASVTALECFKTADLNHDGKLSVEEFKNWFFAPRNDPSFLFSPVRKLLQ